MQTTRHKKRKWSRPVKSHQEGDGEDKRESLGDPPMKGGRSGDSGGDQKQTQAGTQLTEPA